MSDIQPDPVVYETVVTEPAPVQVVRQQAVFTPQRTNTPHLGSKVGLAALSAVTGGVLTWAALHAAGWGTHEVVAAPPTQPAQTTGQLHDGTFTGGIHQVADVGELHVVVTVAGGRITNIDTSYPEDGLSGTINQDAVPQLVADALQSQHANVAMVSGATATSTAFRGSLQDAINLSMGAGGGGGAGVAVPPVASLLQDGTFTGPIASVASPDREYGNAQVTITVAGGQITDITSTYPDENGHSREINEGAVPQLIADAKANQRYNVDTVSGATYTSAAFRESLEGAMAVARGEVVAALPALPAAPSPSPSPTAAELADPIAGLHDGTFTGPVLGVANPEGRHYGDTQVTITVAGGRITNVASTYPGQGPEESGHSLEINEEAVPQLIGETIDLQHSAITAVTGATYTSAAFQHSLQGAILASVAGTNVDHEGEVFTGEAVDVTNDEGRNYGQVAVTIGVENGQIVFITATYPDGAGPSRRINYEYVPQLIAQAKERQSADLDMISGATFTTGAFKESLQDAMNQAHL